MHVLIFVLGIKMCEVFRACLVGRDIYKHMFQINIDLDY